MTSRSCDLPRTSILDPSRCLYPTDKSELFAAHDQVCLENVLHGIPEYVSTPALPQAFIYRSQHFQGPFGGLASLP